MMAAFQIGDYVIHARKNVEGPMKVVQVDGWTVTCAWNENGKEKRCGFVLGVLDRCPSPSM